MPSNPQFWDFQGLWKNLAKFLMSFLEAQISFLSNFVSTLSVIKHNSSVLSKLKHYILWSKAAEEDIESKESCCKQGKGLAKNNKKNKKTQSCSVKKVFLNISWNSHENNYVKVSSLIKTPWKCKFLKLSSGRVKVRQMPYVNYFNLFRFFIILHCHYTLLLCKFWAHAFSTSDNRIPSKSQFWHFQVFWWKFAQFLMSFSKPQVSFSSNFAWLFSIMKDNSSLRF